MKPEEVARTHQFREGFQLVDYGEVGLPIFRLTLEAVTTAYRTTPTIQEFTMRCLALGETREPDIARMLGLKLDIIRGATNVLISDGFVARKPGPAEAYSFYLTETGKARLKLEREEIPQEEMIVIDYDGIRRTPVRLTGKSVVRASELKSVGAVEIRPYPANLPPIDELSIPDVSKVIRRQGGEAFRRTVLALKRIARRNNVFREAVALVFASDKGDEVQLAFAIDGKLSDSHERVFAEHGGPHKMGFVRSITAGDNRKRLAGLIGRSMSTSLPDPAEFQAIRKEEAEASTEVRSIQLAADRVRGRSRNTDQAVVAFAAAEERLKVARFALDSLPIRQLACFEQMDLLEEALENARHSLIITSAGLQPTIVNGFRLRALDILVESGVAVQIETYLPPQAKARGGDHFDPLAELIKRADRGALGLTMGSQRDFFFLVQDDELAVVSNRPFLGDVTRRSGFIRVEGIVTRRADLVEEIRKLATPRLEASRRER